MNKTELEQRTKKFALRVIRFVSGLPKGMVSDVLGRQLLRSGTSIGANYREANRAESRREFVHKISIAEKEAAETQYWLDLCLESGLADPSVCASLQKECAELVAIFTSIGRSTKAKT